MKRDDRRAQGPGNNPPRPARRRYDIPPAQRVDGAPPKKLAKKALAAAKGVGLMKLAKDARKGLKAL